MEGSKGAAPEAPTRLGLYGVCAAVAYLMGLVVAGHGVAPVGLILVYAVTEEYLWAKWIGVAGLILWSVALASRATRYATAGLKSGAVLLAVSSVLFIRLSDAPLSTKILITGVSFLPFAALGWLTLREAKRLPVGG